jgi:hypothetical protein
MRTTLMVTAIAVALGVLAATPAAAGIIQVEDFDLPPNGGFNNAFFNHSVGAAPPPSPGYPPAGPWWMFWDNWSISPQWSLILAPAMDTVTFNLAAGEYVDWAGVWIISNGCPGVMEVIGTKGTYSAGTETWEWKWVDTTGQDLGKITQINLYGYETAFDDLKVDVAPEPATLALLALGGLAVIRRRK